MKSGVHSNKCLKGSQNINKQLDVCFSANLTKLSGTSFGLLNLSFRYACYILDYLDNQTFPCLLGLINFKIVNMYHTNSEDKRDSPDLLSWSYGAAISCLEKIKSSFSFSAVLRGEGCAAANARINCCLLEESKCSTSDVHASWFEATLSEIVCAISSSSWSDALPLQNRRSLPFILFHIKQASLIMENGLPITARQT